MPLNIEALARDFWKDPTPEKHETLRKLCAAEPANAKALVLLFNASCRVSNFTVAQTTFEDLARHYPAHPLSHTGQAELAFARQDHHTATQLFASLDDRYRSLPHIMRKWMQAAIGAGQPSAVNDVADFVDTRPMSVPTLLATGMAAMFRKEFRSAEAAWGKVLALQPSHPEALFQLALAAEQQGRLDDALCLLAAAIHQVPTARHFKARQLQVQLKRAPEELARDRVEDFVVTSQFSRPALQLALDYARRCNLREYEDLTLQRLEESWPAKGQVERAHQALADGKASEAVELLAPVPDEVTLQIRRATLLAHALKSRGDPDGQADLAEALSKPGLHFKLRGVAATIALGLGAMEKAAELARTVRQQAPDDPQFWCVEADALTRDGRGEEALRKLASAPDSVASNLQVLFRKHASARAIGDFEAALGFLDKAAKTGDSRARHRYCDFLGDLGAFDKATGSLGTWIDKTRTDEALKAISKAALHQKQFRFAASLPPLDGVLEADPQNSEALTLRSRARLLTFNARGALEDLNRANKLMFTRGAQPRKHRETILGELANELFLEPDLAARAQGAAASGHPVERLLDLWKSAPGNTMLAIGVLLAMRNAGRLDKPGRANTPHQPRHIPPKIFQYWEGEPPGPDLAAAMDLLKSRNPWANYRRFDDTSALDYLKEHAAPPVVRAFLLARHPAERADLLRLVVLHREGGIWVDADDICRDDLSTVLPDNARLVLYQEWLGSTGNNFLAAAPGDPVLKRALDSSADELLHGATETIWLRTGPGAVSRAVVERLAASDAATLPEGMHIIAGSDLMRVIAPACPFSYKQTAAHWVVAEQG